MHLIKSLLLVAYCFSIPTQASVSTINGQRVPDRWHQINLDGKVTTKSTELSTRDFDISLETRTDITVCVSDLDATATCAKLGSFLVALVAVVSSYIYYASGRNCDTTAQKATIEGALKKYLKEIDDEELCGTECLRMHHGGTWDGWLKIGPKASFDEDAYCGPKLSFSSCISGGDADV
ncbi:uncharacterized protein N7483_010361 [Penicillium malachiteum]|uniref:uncharacterized protein n=1 Tax=Penicillium malachiteum TaxID=1324776 RepID=UPI0025478564|nr:uncharacterized protein N7483_010361 [Penicillium malachiteum]KAJ5713180.1 hypothetical protein N7483_010361 [Penicillium malachiteum]